MRKKTKTILCIAATAVCLFSAVQTTLAAWRVSDPSTHAVSIASLSGQIVEQYEEATDVKAGQTVDKVVNVKNTGSADSVIRLKLEKAWGHGRTEEGVLIPDESFSTDNIILNVNTNMWYYNEDDGYWYYKGVLRPGETTAEPLLNSFTVTSDTPPSYGKMTADIVVRLECLQAAANAIQVWDMTFEELGVVYTSTAQVAKDTKVDFTGEQFTFDPEDSDLFANFKDLLPGESRTQTIVVTNTTPSPVEIFLRAEVMEQAQATPETAELIDRLLKEYVTIIVTDEDGSVVYSGPVWGNPVADASNPESMRYDFSLGNFNAGQTKNLTVQLQVDPVVDNEYQALLAYIRWVWSAQGEDPEQPTDPAGPSNPVNPTNPSNPSVETPVDPPKTGDSNTMYIYFAIMLVSGVILVFLLRTKTNDKPGSKKIKT